MNPKSDSELLREYANGNAEWAFAEIVHRHTSLVYSAALRQVLSPDLAAEVAQTVFVGLARGARALSPRLSPEASLAGWLCRSARNVSLNLRRDEFRRRSRERLAMEQPDTNPEASPDWDKLRPVVDEALSELSETDHDALVMRYFKNQDLLSVGLALGVSDDAAQKRISRALEKLRDFLSRRGITTTAATLAVLLSANAVQTAPAGLAVAISSAAALAGTALTSTTAATIATQALVMTTLQKTLVILAIVAAGMATPLVIQHNALVKLRKENLALREQVGPLAQLTAENERLSNLVTRSTQPAPVPASSEVLRLRGDVGLLRRENEELGRLLAQQQKTTTEFIPSAAWADAGNSTPEAAATTFAWAIKEGNKEKLAGVLMFMQDQTNATSAGFVADIARGFLPLMSEIESSRLVFTENPASDEMTFWYQSRFKDGHTLMSPLTVKQIDGQWKVKMIIGAQGQGQ